MKLFKNKEVALIFAMNLTLLAVVGATLVYDSRTTGQLAALVGTVWLAVLLIAPKLLKMAMLKRWHDDLLMIARNSKWMGIWTALWFALHACIMATSYLDTSSVAALVNGLLQREIILGVLVLLIFALLMAISNKWSYQHVKWWKHLNMLVWLVVPLGFGHALLASMRYTDNLPMAAVLVLFPLMAFVGMLAKFRKDRDYFASMRFWLLVGGALFVVLVANLYWYTLR